MKMIEVGRLGQPYGLEGALKYRGETLVADLPKVFLQDLGYRAIQEAFFLNNELILHFVGVTDRSAAEALGGRAVLVEQSDLPPLEDGEYYYFQLVGRKVFLDQNPVGEVIDLEDAGAQDLLVIKIAGSRKRHMVPLQAPYVRVEAEGIYIDDVPGLFEG